MAKCKPGREGFIRLSFDGGATFHEFRNLTSLSRSGNLDERECTTFDSNGHREYEPDHDDHSWDLEALYEEGDVAADGLFNFFWAKEKFLIEYGMVKGAGLRMLTGYGFPTTQNDDLPMDDNGNISVTIRGSGITPGLQP